MQKKTSFSLHFRVQSQFDEVKITNYLCNSANNSEENAQYTQKAPHAWRHAGLMNHLFTLLCDINLARDLNLLLDNLRQFDGKYAVLHLGRDGVFLHIIGQNEGLLVL